MIHAFNADNVAQSAAVLNHQQGAPMSTCSPSGEDRAKGHFLALVTALIALALATPLLGNAQTLRTGGTGAALGTMRALGEAYKKIEPQFSLEIVPNLGSSGGLKALEQGAVHFAVISRPLKGDESVQGYAAYEYGRTPFVLATSRSDVSNLTLRQIADLYSARVAKWPDGTPVRLVLRPANDADTPLFASFSPAIKEALAEAMSRDGMIVAVTDQDSATELGRIKGAIGTSSLALIVSEKRPLSTIAIDGVKPTAKALSDGSYPYFKSVYVVTKGTPSRETARFLAFVRSTEGRRILTDLGHWMPPAGVAAR
jgi:phosphate transport system substrate-binding protein